MIRLAVVLLLVVGLDACSLLPEKQPVAEFQLARMQHLQQQRSWYFEGRLSLVSERDAVSASINWRHSPELDEIELVGPLAQGRVAITVTPETVTIDDGDKRQEYQGSVDAVVSRQMGGDMPVNALRFWVLGVNDPAQPVVEQIGGFDQQGWQIRFKEMQQVNAVLLPKRLSAEKDRTKIKLIVDQWELS
jgi:outer membrane lipoprotein LolB